MQFDIVGSSVVLHARITPEQAREILAHQMPNRNLSAKLVEEYAYDMAAGIWEPRTNEPVAFNDKDQLIDGQHRLNAIIKYGKPVIMGVMENVLKHYGSGRKRSKRDQAEIVYGIKFGKQPEAIVKIISGKTHMSTWEHISWYLTYQNAIDFAVEITGNKPKITTAPVQAGIAAAYDHIDHDVLQRFAEVLVHGLSDGKGESAAIRLREQLLVGTVNGGVKVGRSAWYRRTKNAIQHFAKQKPIQKLYEPESSVALFPLKRTLPELNYELTSPVEC